MKTIPIRSLGNLTMIPVRAAKIYRGNGIPAQLAYAPPGFRWMKILVIMCRMLIIIEKYYSHTSLGPETALYPKYEVETFFQSAEEWLCITQ